MFYMEHMIGSDAFLDTGASSQLIRVEEVPLSIKL